MGNVTSKADEASPLYLRDQLRLAVTQVKITNSRNRVLYTLLPNAFPATRYAVKKQPEDDGVVEYIQDPDVPSTSLPNFLLRLSNENDIVFHFTFNMRQAAPSSADTVLQGPGGVDTVIKGLTFLFASSARDMDTLVTREFNADPNLHKNPNVDLVGDFSTSGSPLEQFEWSWKWRPPKADRDKGGGWRNTCSFVEYDQRAHRLNTLVTFSFWVQGVQRALGSPKTPPARLELTAPPRVRVTSSQSLDSRLSDSENELRDAREPPSPGITAIPEDDIGLEPAMSNNTVKVDINCQRPGEDVSAVEDGPVFRATMKAMEQKTGNMRVKMKKVLKKAEAAREAQVACNTSVYAFMEALREASTSNANAVQPALDHYFESIATEILAYERQNTDNLQKLIIDPISRLYSNDIKQVDSKKKDFEDESRDYYAYVGRYLGQRQDSLKEKKRVESDTKYQTKRRNFELKRFDYSSFMQDLHGGRKDQEVLSYLTKYADTQAKGYLATAKKIEVMLPQLEALCHEVKEADKEYQLLRTGREEKRRTLEKGNKIFVEPDPGTAPLGTAIAAAPSLNGARAPPPDVESAYPGAIPGSASSERPKTGVTAALEGTTSGNTVEATGTSVTRSSSTTLASSPGQNKFKGIRDLEESDRSTTTSTNSERVQQRKEGLLWSLSRPGSHADPKGLNKQAWHKFWIVLDQGKLSEYVNWKQNLESHIDPIDLRIASVREARGAERRFCFEVITPNFTRVYQAPSEEDMRAWILAINNALQSAFEDRSTPPEPPSSARTSGSIGRDLFGKSSSYHGHRSSSTSNAYLAAKNVARHATVGERTPINRIRSNEDRPARLLQSIREADAGNAWCAECGSESRVEWVAINLGIIVCIECSGIHRSLGTHISKIRSLILDTNSFTQDVVELLLQIGNRVSNMIWEAAYGKESPAIPRPTPASIRDVRTRFITAKYADRAFVRQTPMSIPSETQLALRQPVPDESLLSSIKKSDMQGVLHALFSLRASPDARDRSRATPAIFLALAAADPATPASTSTPDATPAASATSSSQQDRKSFPIAELLMQNGAELPMTPPPFPLGKSAKAYLDLKQEQRSGKPRSDGDGANNDASGDVLTALPSAGSSGIIGSNNTKDLGDRSKLVKRISSTSRSGFGSTFPGIN